MVFFYIHGSLVWYQVHILYLVCNDWMKWIEHREKNKAVFIPFLCPIFEIFFSARGPWWCCGHATRIHCTGDPTGVAYSNSIRVHIRTLYCCIYTAYHVLGLFVCPAYCHIVLGTRSSERYMQRIWFLGLSTKHRGNSTVPILVLAPSLDHVGYRYSTFWKTGKFHTW